MADSEHLAKLKEGVEAWNKWREENRGIEPSLENADLSEAHLKNVDLREAHLKNADLSGAHLENADLRVAHLENADLFGTYLEKADLFGARLEKADLFGAHLENADLRGVHLENADLRGAHLENVDLRGAHLENVDLFGAHLESAVLREANLTNANVSGLFYLGHTPQKHITQLLHAATASLWNWLWNNPIPYGQRIKHIRLWLSGASTRGWHWLWNWLRNNPIPYRHRMMRNRYQGIRGLDSCYGNRIFVRDAGDQDYLDTVENQLHSRWGKFWFWFWGLSDYGRSFVSVIVLASIFICSFGWVYSHCHQLISSYPRSPTPFTPYYFSIVTYTTLGFGDVRPNNMAGEILVSIEVILGYVTLGLLLAVLGDRIARRS